MNDLKIVLYLQYLHSGGAQIVFKDLANNFVKRGLRVTLVVANGPGPVGRLIDERVQIVYLRANAELKNATGWNLPLLRVKARFRNLIRLVKLVRKEAPNILITGLNDGNVLGTIAVKLSRSKCKVVATQHSNFTMSMLHQDLHTRFLRIALPLAFAVCDQLVAVSNGVKNDLISRFPNLRSKVRTIYNPVLSTDFSTKSSVEISDPWLTNTSGTLFAVVGRLTASKRVADVMKAFYHFRSNSRARLAVVGDGPELFRLKALSVELGLGDDCHFFGFQDNPLPFIKAANCIISASEFEGLGNVLVEALACGTPVISSDCDFGPREVLAEGRYGYLFEVGDVSSLLKHMKTFRQDKRLAGSEYLQKFNLETVTDEWMQLFDEIHTGSK